MYKVSFTNDFKKVERFSNKVTKVTLKGTIKNAWALDDLNIPQPIYDWMRDNNCKDLDTLEVSGFAVRSDNDKDDPVLGERLAEARAKLKIYKFMKTFCNKMLKYYTLKLYGTKASNNTIVIKVNPEKDSLFKAYMKYDELVNVENTHIKQLLYDY